MMVFGAQRAVKTTRVVQLISHVNQAHVRPSVEVVIATRPMQERVVSVKIAIILAPVLANKCVTLNRDGVTVMRQHLRLKCVMELIKIVMASLMMALSQIHVRSVMTLDLVKGPPSV
jgi:hypothetical protein